MSGYWGVRKDRLSEKEGDCERLYLVTNAWLSIGYGNNTLFMRGKQLFSRNQNMRNEEVYLCDVNQTTHEYLNMYICLISFLECA